MKKQFPAVVLAVMGAIASLLIGATSVRAEEAVTEDVVTFEEAFGAASGLALYNVQVIIGITADAMSLDVYSSEEAFAIIGEQQGALSTISDYSEKLRQLATTSEADKQSLAGILSCIEELNSAADALTAYLEAPTDDNADIFQEKRMASYDALAELLGLDD